jgi:serine protease Do
MKTGRLIGISVALAVAACAGLVLLAPVARGQAAASRHGGRGDGSEVRALEILSGRGSQIGVSIRDVEEADVKRAALPSPSGAVVEEVRDETPADAAGFKAGDVVTAFDGERVRSAQQFARLVDETPSGRRVKATVVRDGKSIDLEVTPEAGSGLAMGMPRDWQRLHRLPPTPGMSIDPFEFEFHGEPGFAMVAGRGRLGVGVQDLTPELAEYFGVKQGVLVNSIEKDAPGAAAGLKPGDVITEVNGTRIEDSSELRRQIWRAEGEVTIGVVRDKKALSLKVRLEEPDENRKISRRGPVSEPGLKLRPRARRRQPTAECAGARSSPGVIATSVASWAATMRARARTDSLASRP